MNIVTKILINRKTKQIRKKRIQQFHNMKLKPFDGNINEYFKMVRVELNAIGELVNDCIQNKEGFEDFDSQKKFDFLSVAVINQLDELTCIQYEFESRHKKEFKTKQVLKNAIMLVGCMNQIYAVIHHNSKVLAHKLIDERTKR